MVRSDAEQDRRFATRVLVPLLFALLPGVLLLPAWRLAGLGASEDDILYYLPTRVLFAETVAAGEFPWLNPYNGLGRPFTSDPQTAVFYPPTWLFAIAPPLLAYPALLWAHYSVALAGGYRLLRGQGLLRAAALFGATAFAFGGFMLAHRAHFTMVHAAAWLPWVLWALERDRRVRSGRSLALAAVVVALQMFAGHLQVAGLTLLAAVVMRLCGGRGVGPAALLAADLLRGVTAWALAAAMFAVQWLPTLLYLRLCTRTSQTYLQFTENSWNPLSLIGLAFPMFFGQRTPNAFPVEYWGPSHQVEQFAYPGLLVLLLAGATIAGGWRAHQRARAWIGLAAFGGLLALGLYGPVCPLLYWLPGASVFRVPARALLLVNLALAGLAAFTLNQLLSPLSPHQARLRFRLLGWTGHPMRVVLLMASLLVPFLLAAPLLPSDVRSSLLQSLHPLNPAVWWPLVACAVCSFAVYRLVRDWQSPVRLAWLTPLLALDLVVIGWTLDVPAGAASADELLRSPRRAAWLAGGVGDGRRLWTVTRRAGGTPGEYLDSVGRGVANTNVFDHIPVLTDYGPLQPRNYKDAFGFEPWGELKAPGRLLADTSWMAACNVGWILLTDAELPAPADAILRLEERASDGGGGFRLYEYPETRGEVFLATPYPVVIVPLAGARNEVRARLHFTTLPDAPPVGDERVLAVASRLALPGWSVQVNGQAARAVAVSNLLLGVEVPPVGDVEVAWTYRPPGLAIGAAISGVGMLVIGLGMVWPSAAHHACPSS